MKNFVTSEWLKENSGRDNLLIFDVRYQLGNEEYGLEEYNKGHIDGAIFIPMEDILTGNVGEHGGRHPLPDMMKFSQTINDLGVDNESTVVAYDDGELAMAGRLWWMLRYIGKEEVYILKGGIKEWKDRGYDLSKDIPEPSRGGRLTLSKKPDMIADVQDVRRAIQKEDEVVVDSRTPDRYRGEIEPIDRIPGHIPTSVNYPWTELVENMDKWDSEIEKLKNHYRDLQKYNKILVHCGSGITGTVNAMFMEEVGLKPVLYLGGYSDWISYEENRVINEFSENK
ncbi:MAG: sulfurtransferase [Bacillota bacterium]